MRKLTVQFLLQGGSILFLPFCMLRWLWRLWGILPHVRASDVAIVESHAVNYGLGLMFADTFRRVLNDKRLIVVLVWEPAGSQNKKLGEIFTDISLYLSRSPFFLFSLFGKRFCLPEKTMAEPLLDEIARRFFRVLAPKTDILRYSDIYHSLPVPAALSHVFSRDNIENAGVSKGLFSHVLWASLVAGELPAPKPVMPDPIKSEIHEKLLQARGRRKARLCTMHNRKETHEIMVRDGSPMEAYLPAIGLLVNHGFQVMLSGDRRLEDKQFDDFSGMVVDARRLGVDLEYFRLFASIETDIVIGEGEAGMILPMIMDKPSIAFNIYGVVAMPGKWIYPKRATDESGNPVPYRNVVELDPYGNYALRNICTKALVYHKNTSEEIYEGVKCFLEDLKESGLVRDVGGPEKEILEKIPPLSFFHVFSTRFSPAFIRRDREARTTVEAWEN